MFKRDFTNYGRRARKNSNECHTCGEVFLPEELREMARGVFLCGKCYIPKPEHIPKNQTERWWKGVRKKSIQSDGEKRR